MIQNQDLITQPITIQQIVVNSIALTAVANFGSSNNLVYSYTVNGTAKMFSGKVPLNVITTYNSNAVLSTTTINLGYEGTIVFVVGSIPYTYQSCSLSSSGPVTVSIYEKLL